MRSRLFSLFIVMLLFPAMEAQRDIASTVFDTDAKIIPDIFFSASGEVIGIADNKTIKVFMFDSGDLLAEFENGHNDRILTADISHDSTLMVTGGSDSLIVIWDFINNIILKSKRYHQGTVTSVKISPDRRFVLSGSTDNTVCLYNILQDKKIYEIKDHKNAVTCVVFSPDGRQFASAGSDGMINVYNTIDGTLAFSLKAHKGWVRSICFSGDGLRLISCGDDAKEITWKLAAGTAYRELVKRYSSGWITSNDIKNDNKTIVVGDIYGNITITGEFGSYRSRVGCPINKILFTPGDEDKIIIAAATRGKGVIMAKAENMKYKSN